MTFRKFSSRAAALVLAISLSVGPVAFAAPKPGKSKGREEIVRAIKRVMSWLAPQTNEDPEDIATPPIPPKR